MKWNWAWFSFSRHNDQKTFLVWVNEEDHLRVISMQKGGNMKEVFRRFCTGLQKVMHWNIHTTTIWCLFFRGLLRTQWHKSNYTLIIMHCLFHSPPHRPDWGDLQEAQPRLHVERASGLHPDLPLQPGNRPARWRARQAAKARHTRQVRGDPAHAASEKEGQRKKKTKKKKKKKKELSSIIRRTPERFGYKITVAWGKVNSKK